VSEVWAKDCDCLTALHCAAFRGHVAFCEKIVQHSSFAEVCKTGLLDLVTLRNARDDVRLVLQKALEDLGLSLPSLDVSIEPDAREILVADDDPPIQVADEMAHPRASSSTTREEREGSKGSVDAALKEIFSGSPLLAIHHQLQVANVKPLDYFKQLDQDSDGRLTLDELEKCLRSIGYKATFKELQDLMRLDGSTSSISIVLLDRAVKLEGAEYEAKRRKELEQAMRKAVGLDMDDPSLDEEVHPAIVVLLRKLKESKIRMFDLFRQYDQDRDGVWSSAELRTALQSMGCDLQDGDVETLMEMMDSNRNGFIDVKELARALHRAELRSASSGGGSDAVIELEFMDALQEITATAALVAIYERLELNKLRTAEFLELFDRSSDAYLTPAELQTGLRQIGYEISQQELDALLFVLDVERIGMLSIKEFEHRMKKAALEALEAAAHRVADSPTDTSIVDVLEKVNAGLRAGKMTVYGRKIYDGHGNPAPRTV